MIGLLISVWLAFTSATVPQWNYVRDLQTYGEQRCESECLVDRRCVSWTYNDSNINNQGQGQCYLQSELFERLSSRIRPTSISTDSPQYKIGNSSSHQYTSRMRLLSGPVAIGRSTVINFPQSFYFGCSYTISAWFWLWKVTKMPLRHEMPIFSTHESTPALYSHQAILPSVVFNIGSRRDNIFFSTLKDSRGDYEGTWGGEVEYNKWIHLAITFSRDKMMVYMNGKLHCEPMVMSKKQQYLSHVCPEIEYPHHLNRTTALPNNTIMQLGGSKQGSMLGMLSNIDIFRGLALDEHHIKQWMLQNIPVQFPTLQKLVQTSAKYIFKTSIGYQDDYALVDYGICPVSKCGPICVPTEVIPPDEEVQNVDNRDEASWGGDALDGVESVSSEITPHGDIDISPQGDVSQDEKTDTSTSFTSDPPEEVATDRDTPSRLKTSDLLKKQEKEWKNMFQLPNEGNWDDMGDLLNLDDATLQEISDIYGIDSALLDPTMSDEEILRALSEAAGYDVGLDGLNWDKTTERLLDEYYASAYYDNGHTDDMSFATGNHKSDHTGSSTVDDDITVIEEDYYYGDEYYIEDAVDYDEIELPNLDSETPQQQTESSTATPSDTPIQPVKLTAAELKARLDVQLRDPYFRTYVRAPAVGRDAEEYDSGKDTSSRSAAFSSGKLYSEVASIVASVLSVLRGQLYALRDGVLQHIQTTLDFLGLNVSAYNSSVINATASYEKSKYDKDIDAVLQRMLEKSSLLRDRLTSESEQVMRDWISTLASQHVDGVDVLEALLEGSFMVVESEASDPRVERIIELYDQAMHWMSGRHIVHTYDQLNGDKVMTRVMTRVHENDTRNIGHGIESTSRSDAVHGKSSRRSYMSDINIYRERSFEPSQSTLMAAMWLSDELELEYSILAEGGYFSNQQAGMLGQGPRLALGSRHNDMSPTVRYQGDFREYVSDIVHGKMEVLALGGGASDADISNPKSTVESTVIESADNKVRTSDDKAEEFGTTYLDFVAAVARMDAFLDSDSLIDENLKDILINVSSDAHSVSLSPSRVYNATIADRSDSLLHRIETSECIVAASYYLPVMRYVLANYGDTTTGVAIPEDIRLADIPSLDQLIGGVSGATSVGGDGGYTAGARQTATSDAMETSIRTHYVAEAAAGNPQAQVWLGIRSFWGSHGLEPNATAARKYFEMAAAKNHSEALYCLGAMYDNGQGGLPRNRTKALELFRLSAEQKVPWPASLQALGNYHWNSGPSVSKLLM